MKDEQFRQILLDTMEEKNFGKSDLARFLGMKFHDIHRLLERRQSPRSELAFMILDKLGWDFDRAKPGYIPKIETTSGMGENSAVYEAKPRRGRRPRKVTRESSEHKLRIDGTIDSSSGDVKWESKTIGIESIGLTRIDDSIFFFLVTGDGFAPTYPEGSIIVSKTQKPKDDFPNGKMVILKSNQFRRVKAFTGWKGRYISIKIGRTAEDEGYDLSASTIHSVVIKSIRPE